MSSDEEAEEEATEMVDDSEEEVAQEGDDIRCGACNQQPTAKKWKRYKRKRSGKHRLVRRPVRGGGLWGL